MQIQKPLKVYDVAIIGSGASGGMTAHVLTQKGLDVAMLEAGPMRKISELPVHRLRRWNLPYRGLRGDYFREWLDMSHFLIDDAKEPYAWEGKDWFEWVRVRAVGGKSLFWAGVTPRFGPNEFQPKDDFDTRWPITYEEIEPFYDRVEEMIGVSSTVQAVGGFPLNKGLPPLHPKCAEVEMTKAAEKLGRGLKVLPIPKAILTKDHNGRPACHYCGPCWLGCDSGSKFDSLRVFVMGAQRTGRLTLLTGARVRSLELGDDGKIKSVHYYDVADKTWREIRAKTFVLGAGCIESAQILLNSRIANSSGIVGRYLSEHMYAGVGGFLPQLMGRKVVNEDGNGAHVIIPDLTENWRGKKYIRGYQIFPSGGISEFTMIAKQLAGYGQEWKKQVRDYYTGAASVLFQGEVLPYRENRVEVDELLKDDAGIPGVRFHYKWGENERAMFRDMMEVGNEMMAAAGAEYSPNRNAKPFEYGHSIHYVGTARMGKDPNTSVLNPWNQSHDVPNLFVHDAAAFVTAGNQNPTLTILALALRSSERIAELMRTREL
jgi:choline dehydrogenase-like flavoprotein